MLKIDRSFAKTLGEEIVAALQTVADRHGLLLIADGGSYTPGYYRPFVSFGTKTENGRPTEWDFLSRQFGFAPEDWGRTFDWKGAAFRIDGINTSRFKFPIQAIRVKDGKPFKFSAEHVKTLLARAANAAPAVNQSGGKTENLASSPGTREV